ncbi:MAG: HD domain-containing protein [Ignavibacteriales bacterium]|nr:MAG: HD domain-containing protein [Ignavibacteriales bacterium]
MTSFVNKVAEYATKLLSEKLPAGCVYHNLAHTTEVVESVKEIGKHSNLTDAEMELTLIAAWMHDLGLTENYEEHEQKSVELSKSFLKQISFPENKIEKVGKMILSTQIPQSPSDISEQVLCDADLAHLGRKGYNARTQLLRAEWETMAGKKFSDTDWYKINIEFLNKTKFHTKCAKLLFDEQKDANLSKLQKKLKKEIMDQPSAISNDATKINPVEDKPKKEKLPERGIETMFRNTMRTHVEFSAMADNKANIMISVNTLLLTAIIAVLARKLDSNPHLIVPTAVITIVSLTTLIFATVATRPKITSGIFTKEDIEQKRANLLFFGNFFKMDLKNFEWGMLELMKDQDYLYRSMIKDFYFLGQVVGRKYQYLRICYNIFMYGLIISVLAFTIAIMLHPGGTNLSPLIE